MSKQYQHKLSDEIQEGTMLKGIDHQVWRPVIPMPLFVGFGLRKSKCECGRVFRDEQSYKEHYIYQAVWQNESGYIPELLKKHELTSQEKSFLKVNKEHLK